MTTITRRRPLILLVAVVVAVVLALATTWLLTRQDPEESVAAVEIRGVRVSPPPVSPAAAERQQQQQVEALETLTGTLQRGSDTDEFILDNSELDFGPDTWVLTAGPIEDFDGDGKAERLSDELDGLVGRQVTAMVRFDADGDDAEVYVLNDRTYRDSASTVPPWEPKPYAGKAASTETVTAAAAAAVGRGARVTDLERVRAGQVAWEASVTDSRSREYTVALAADAGVIDLRRD